MNTQTSFHLSVIIPAFNEESRLPKTLSHVLSYLSLRDYSSEVIIADDGSTDHTVEIVNNWPPGPIPVRLVQHPNQTNQGKGAAVKRGILAAEGAYRLVMDADNSTSIEQIEGFWPFFQNNFDFLIGSRKTAGSMVTHRQSLMRELAGGFGNWIIRLLAVPGIADTQAGFKIFSRQAVDIIFHRLTIDRWGFDVEILAVARLHGLKFREVPIIWNDSAGSKVRWHAYLQVLLEVFRIRRNILQKKYN